MKNKVVFIVFLSLFLFAGCSQDKVEQMNADWGSEDLEELGFSENSDFGTKIKMVDNKNEVVANYIEITDTNGSLEGYIISDYVTGEIYEYTLGKSGLFYLVSKANLEPEIVENNSVYYAGLATIVVSDDEGNLYHLLDSEDKAAEKINQEELDIIFKDKKMEFGK